MFAPLRWALFIATISIAIYMAYPLIIFTNDFLRNPECIKISVESIQVLNETHEKAEIRVYYCSRADIRDIELVVGRNIVYFDRLTTGINSKVLIVDIRDLEFKSIEFTILNLMRVKLGIK